MHNQSLFPLRNIVIFEVNGAKINIIIVFGRLKMTNQIYINKCINRDNKLIIMPSNAPIMTFRLM